MALDDKRFVGREREQALFASILAALGRGQGEVVLVAGEPGIGKTRLLLEYAGAAERHGMEVCWGRAPEAGGAPALWPWQQVLAEVVRRRGRDGVLAAAGPGLPFIARLVPGLVEVSAGSESESASARLQLFDAVTRLLTGVGRLALVLDDLHAADLATLLLLEHAAPQLCRSGVLVLGSFRPEELERTPGNARILWRVAREATHLPLGRLARDEVAELLEAVLGRAASREELQHVARVTEGSPLFVQEYGRLLRASGSLPATPPPAIRHTIDARLERLPETTRAALVRVSVLGRELDPRVVAQLGVGLELLEPAVATGLLVDLGDAWHFSHALIRDALYARLPTGERARLHERAGDILAAFDRPPTEIAHHRMLAFERIDEAALVRSVVKATSHLVRMLAFDDAAELALRALALRPYGERARGELLVQLGSAHIRAGRVAEGKRCCMEVAAIAQALHDDELFARAALNAGVDFTPGAVDPELVALLEAAAALPLGDRTLAARLMARLAAAHQPARDPDPPMRLAHEAIALAREVGDPAVMLDVLAGASSALAYFEVPEVRERLDTELLGLAERSGDRVLVFRTLVRLCFDELDRGRSERAAVHLEACERTAEALGQPRFVRYAALLRAALCVARGERARADEGERVAARLGEPEDRGWQRVVLVHRLSRACLEDRTELLPELEGQALRLLDGGWFVEREVQAATLARIRARLGDRAGVQAAIARLEAGSWAETREMLTMAWLTEPFIVLGDRARLRALYEHMRPYAGWHVTAGPPYPLYEGPFSRCLALLASALGEAEADAWFERAVSEASEAGASTVLARVLVERIEHRARAGPGVAGLGVLAAEALDLASGLGLEALAARARVYCVGAWPATRGPTEVRSRAQPDGAIGLRLRRDGDTWELVFAGEVGHFRDSRGFRMLARLVAEPGREVSALALDGSGEGEGAAPGSLGVEALDATAVRAYRARVTELREALEEAESAHDLYRCERLRGELASLEGELARGLGLGGRVRRLAAPSERARINVQRRIKDALSRVSATLPEAGRHLERSVRTGSMCVYTPR